MTQTNLVSKIEGTQLWSFLAEGKILDIHIAGISNCVVLLDDTRHLYYLNDEGKLLWRKKGAHDLLRVRITDDGSRVNVLAQEGQLACLNEKGDILWHSIIGVDAACLDAEPGGRCLVAGGKRGLCYLVSATGTRIGNFELEQEIHSIAFVPLISRLIVASNRARISYCDLTGDIFWIHKLDTNSAAISCSGTGNLIVLPAYTEGVYIFDSNGTSLGLIDTGEPVKAGITDRAGTRLLLTCGSGYVILCDIEGNALWRHRFDEKVSHIAMNASGDRAVVATSLGYVHLIKLLSHSDDGDNFLEFDHARNIHRRTELWRKPIFSGFESWSYGITKVSADGSYIAAFGPEQTLFFINKEGNEVHRTRLTGASPKIEAIDNGAKFIAYTDRHLVCFDCHSGQEYIIPAEYAAANIISVKVAASEEQVGRFALLDDAGTVRYYSWECNLLWELAFPGGVHNIEISPSGESVFIVNSGDRLDCLNSKGERKWHREIVSRKVRSLAAVRDSLSILSSDGKVICLNSYGNLIWKINVPENASDIFALANTVIVRVNRNKFFILNGGSGGTTHEVGPREGESIICRGESDELLEINCKGNMLSCRSVNSGVLWRFEAAEPVYGPSVSANGLYLALFGGPILYYFSLTDDALQEGGMSYIEV